MTINSGVATSKVITVTFNNALQAGAIHNVILATAAGVRKATTNTLNTARKVMTVTPDTALAGGTTYILAIGVTDIYGSSLATSVNFATT